MKKIAIAFAGSGAVRPLTISSLLNDWLGFGEEDEEGFYEPSDHEIQLFFPVSQNHWNDEIDKVLTWSAKADLPYTVVLEKGERGDEFETIVSDATKTIEAVNVSKALVDALAEADATEKYVVLLWSDEDEEAENVLTLAELKDIPAKDLVDGLDDLSFDDGAEEEPEPAPKPEPEPEPKRTRGSRRRGKEEPEEPAEVPLDEAEEEIEEEPAPAPKRERKPRAEKPELAKETMPEIAEPEYVSTDGINIDKEPVDFGSVIATLKMAQRYHQSQDVMFAQRNMAADVIPSALTIALGEAIESLQGKPVVAAKEEPLVDAWGKPTEPQEEAEEAPKRGRGRPRTKEPVTSYLHHETTDTYRKAGRGRPRKGEVKVDLTAAQVAEISEQGLLVDED